MTAQVIAFPNQKRRVEIRALDEQLAGIALRVRGLERQAEELEAARDVLDQALEATEGGREG